MTREISPNTQAILLLTAPLIAGRGKPSVKPLSPGEYNRLARALREMGRQPADLLDAGQGEASIHDHLRLDAERLERLLGRGVLLSQAIEHWQARTIWVLSRADPDYPRRLKKRLGAAAPPLLYGCGDVALLGSGGLAVVGSRHVDEALVEQTEAVGRLAASARRTLVSGGARGIDQAAMRGALDAGGRVCGALADGLERAALAREHRSLLMEGRLVLTCPYDPAVRFHVGHAMQRNKVIYALADAALVVSSELGKGGTWAGAVEQLDKYHSVPVYVRSNGESTPGLDALRQKGARPWPNPGSAEALQALLDRPPAEPEVERWEQPSLLSFAAPGAEPRRADEVREEGPGEGPPSGDRGAR